MGRLRNERLTFAPEMKIMQFMGQLYRQVRHTCCCLMTSGPKSLFLSDNTFISPLCWLASHIVPSLGFEGMSQTLDRPESQLAQTNLLYQHQGCGVKASPAQTFEKLGFFSPAYTTGRSGTHGVIGSAGYLSASYTMLLPATGPRSRDAGLGHTHARSSSVSSHGRSTGSKADGGSTPRQKIGLSQEDLEYLQENEKRNKEAWEAWSQARDSETKEKRTAASRCVTKMFHVIPCFHFCVLLVRTAASYDCQYRK